MMTGVQKIRINTQSIAEQINMNKTGKQIAAEARRISRGVTKVARSSKQPHCLRKP